jgi:vitamin-K-epoxide reductase (warfarin-sensitive)
MQAAMNRTRQSILTAISLMCVAGIAVSAVSLYHHYGTGSSFCSFGENFNCDMVNRSIYSVLFGIPVAVIGVLGYAALFLLARLRRRTTPLVAVSLLGLGFAVYLTYIEAFVLAVWCILCLTSLTIILTITCLSLALHRIANVSEYSLS